MNPYWEWVLEWRHRLRHWYLTEAYFWKAVGPFASAGSSRVIVLYKLKEK